MYLIINRINSDDVFFYVNVIIDLEANMNTKNKSPPKDSI